MASGHLNRIYRPNTWPHRPSLRRKDFSCQPGAVHTWHEAAVVASSGTLPQSNEEPPYGRHRHTAALDSYRLTDPKSCWS